MPRTAGRLHSRNRDNSRPSLPPHDHSTAAEHRQEGGTLATEVGRAYFLEEIQGTWMIRPAGGPRYGPPCNKYQPPASGTGRAVGNSTNPGAPHRAVTQHGPRGEAPNTEEAATRLPHAQPAGSQQLPQPQATQPQSQQPTIQPQTQQPAARQAADFPDGRPLRGQQQQAQATTPQEPQPPPHFYEVARDSRQLGRGTAEHDNTELWQRQLVTTTTTTTTTSTTDEHCSQARTGGSHDPIGTTTDEEQAGLIRRRRRTPYWNRTNDSRRRGTRAGSSHEPPQPAERARAAALQGAIVAATTQLQLIQTVATTIPGAEGQVINNICSIALVMLADTAWLGDLSA